MLLKNYHDTVDPKSPRIVLFSPSGSPNPHYAEFGWVASGPGGATPGPETLWTADAQTLTPATPVTLTFDNGQGLIFRREISVDDKYLFTVRDAVENTGSAPATLHPYGLVSRHGKPVTQGYYVLHEGLVGVLGEQGLQEYTYDNVEKEPAIPGQPTKGKVWNGVSGGFVGITDKYWAAAVAPDQTQPYTGSFTMRQDGPTKVYQSNVLGDARTLAPGAKAQSDSRLFAGAKEVATVDTYERTAGIKRFDLLIDWGWFYFITKPLFKVLDYFFRLFGNFGVAILIVTVMLKVVFFPLANRSYASMAKMKAVQPEMVAIRERYADDKVKQQQALMELYKKEKINPDRRLLADPDPDPGVLRALQGAVRHDRDAACAVLRLDPRPCGAGPDDRLQPVRAPALRPDGRAGDRAVPASRRVAHPHGHHDVAADEDEPGAGGPRAAAGLRLDAADLHLHAGLVPGRPRDLLGLEQPALGDAAIRDHAQERRQGGALGQSARHLREEDNRKSPGQGLSASSASAFSGKAASMMMRTSNTPAPGRPERQVLLRIEFSPEDARRR